MLAAPVAITLGAQAGVLVPALLVFGQVPLVSVPANVLAGPVAGGVMLYGLPAGLVAGAVPAVAPVVMLPCRLGVRWVDLVAMLGARLEPGGAASRVGWLVVLVAVGVLVTCGSRPQPPVRIASAMAVHLLTGDDESILRNKAHDLVAHLVGDDDRSLLVDEFDGEEYELRSVVDAAQTLPFLTDRRIVVARDIGRFTADELAPLLGYLTDPLDTTQLVLVAGGGRLPKKLTDAVSRPAGTSPTPTRRARRATARRGCGAKPSCTACASTSAPRRGSPSNSATTWAASTASSPCCTRRSAKACASPRATSNRSSARPATSHRGTSPMPSTPARRRKALTMMSRMMNGGERHPLQIMAILHTHYVKLARLDGVDARSEREAAEAMGIKPGFPARKALGNYQRLGGGGVKRAIGLLAAADLDLRGATDLDSEMVMEVLVARLSRLEPAALTFFIRRLFLRAAVFLWMMPFEAAESIFLTATRTASAFESSPIVRTAVLVRLLSSLRVALLRSAALALVRLRFFWLLMFATGQSLFSIVGRLGKPFTELEPRGAEQRDEASGAVRSSPTLQVAPVA